MIIEITKKRLGATAIIENNELVGIITDGDIRRLLQKNDNIAGITASEVMSNNPKTITAEALAVDALHKMQKYNISQLIVLDYLGNYAGMIHLHDLLKEGII